MTGNFQLAIHLFLQLTVILVTCRAAGRALRLLGQTQVVSEMVAGVLLGPSLLGLIAPGAQEFLFPRDASMSILYALSQLGLVLYMFLIGLQLNHEVMQDHSRAALTISFSGIVTPMLMGGVFGWLVADNVELFTERIAPWQAALFLASAMSITAFPMLGRILYESGMAQTRIGTLSLGAAAMNDAAAWALLACIVATFKGDATIALLAVGGGCAYALTMVFVGRRAFSWFARAVEGSDGVRLEILATLLLVLMFCAWLTDLIGIYSIFGAFICGAVMPRGKFVGAVTQSVEPLTVTLLLPMFFVYSGLNTQLKLIVQPSLFSVTVAAIVIAFVCKGGGCAVACKLTGASWREAAAVGTLMNARGLMELILVNIALEKGLITSGLFTILVLMAIVTTLVASPLFKALNTTRRSS